MQNESIEMWHQFVKTGNQALLETLLDGAVVFHSPVIHTPQVGKELTKMYLTTALKVFSDSQFTYVRQVSSDNNLVLEFKATIDTIVINGVDIITFNEKGKIIDFKVMIRPLKAINAIQQHMLNVLQN
jgi:hypothetical protein